MRQIFTAKEIEDLLARGGAPEDIPEDALLTPSAKDAILDYRRAKNAPGASAAPPPALPKPLPVSDEFEWTPGSDPQTQEEIETFFRSEPIEALKQQMCETGRRMWQRDYTDGNGGNISIRTGDNLALCTPTLISKGFMQPEDICLVDLDGRQLAGIRQRTSEILTHLAVMKAQPQAKACCHAHPPHATAFAVAKVQPPTCMIPEAEVFLGQIALAEYDTPGTPAVAERVGRLSQNHHAILMVNHGVLTWGKTIEDAYWKMENTDAYCRTVWVASFLGNELSTISAGQMKELLEIRKKLGMSDPREGLRECDLCNNDNFRPGVVCNLPAAAPGADTCCGADTAPAPEAEALVRQITDIIMENTVGASG